MPRHTVASAILALLAASILLAAGCGYSTHALVNPQYKTIAVPIFKNETRYRKFEFELTRAVIDEIEKKTHLKVVNSGETADTILYGNLVAYRLIPTVETEDDVVTQYRLIVTLDLKWIDRKTGKALFTDPVFSENAYAALEAGETLRDARREAFSEVAEKVIDRMEMRW